MIQLRPLREDDLQYFAQWWRDVDLIALTSGNFSALPDDQLEKYFEDMLAERSRIDRMIELNGSGIGHVSVQERADGWWELQIIIGEKNWWGHGYGPQAIEQFLAMLHMRGIKSIYLEVRPDNIRAIRAYQKCGFVEVGKALYPYTSLPETVRMELQKGRSLAV